MFLMNSIVFGKKLVSVPFAPYGGVCADNETVEKALVEDAKRITEDCGADYLELRNITVKQESDLIVKSLQVTSVLDLDSNPDCIWNKMKRDKRRGIKKAKEANLEILWGSERIKGFYKVYARTMWQLGTPVHSIDFFKNIIREFPDSTNIVMAKYESDAIASIFLLFFKEGTISGWSGSLREYSRLYPNNLAYWETLKYCCEKGYKYFDFGRSMPNSGIHEFKKSLGAETKYLHYQYYLNNKSGVPNITVASPKRKLFAGIWKKMPFRIASGVGPIFRRCFP
jgi:FemAB-related protein (PEP-CTERM system-associated)